MGNPEQGLAQNYLGIERTAQSCDVSIKTIKRWLAHGLPHFQEGPRTKVLIDPHDIRAFLTRQQVAQPNLNDLNEMMEEVMQDLSRNGTKKRTPNP